MENKIVRIGFIGAGAIGSLFGGYLALAIQNDYSTKIIFFARPDHVKAVNRKGLVIQKNSNILTIKNIKAFDNYNSYKSSTSLDNRDDFEYLFITTKTYNTKQAINAYKNLIDSSKWIILLQNGIGNEELVKNYVTREKLIRIVTSHGAILKQPGYILHTGTGFTKMGFAFPGVHYNDRIKHKVDILPLNRLKHLLDKGNIESEVVDDIIRYTWEKAFVNLGINAIGALTRLKNGDILKYESLRSLMMIVVKEALNVAKAHGLQFQEEKYIDLMFSVAKQTANNENSMLQDVSKRKPTEIDFLNGKVVDLASSYGIEVPFNKILTYIIKGLEQSYLNED
jgi:2-dehydropantoate 2-reductase